MTDKTPQQLFAQAVIAVHKGRSQEAEDILRGLLADAPQDADALHVLGIICFQSGRPDEAADLIRKAIEVRDDDPAYYGNFAAVLNELGLWEPAEEAARKALALAPGFAEAWNNLAIALQEMDRLDDAVEAANSAVAAKPDFAPARITLGNIRRRQGRTEEAVAAYRDAVRLDPGSPLAHASLGAALRETGRLGEAEAACRQAVELAPHYVQAINVLGTVLQARGDGEGAVEAFEQAIAMSPGHAEAQLNLAAALFQAGRVDDSLTAYRQAAGISFAAARARNGLGVVLLAEGRMEEAQAAFREALGLDPHLAEAYYNLAAAKGDLSGDNRAAMEGLLAEEGRPNRDRTVLHFALGEVLDREGQAEAAFRHFAAGNQGRRAQLAAQGITFDANAFDARIDRLIETFDAESVSCWRRPAGASELPVFVVGLPRSGTTLIEQILASHPAVFGAGELDAVGGMAAALMEGGEAPSPEAHLARLAALGQGAKRVVDKTPGDILHLGVIARLFPGARVIHCRRDPRDTGLSCFQQNFQSPLPWTTDLGDIGRYWRATGRLMVHWRSVLPLPLLEIDYEAVVSEPEEWSRRMIDFLGLPWDDACLKPHETRRLVRSASGWQVRQPIHGGSVGRWKGYAPFLGPLLDVLGEDG